MASRAENSGLLRRLTLGGAVATLPFLLGLNGCKGSPYASGQVMPGISQNIIGLYSSAANSQREADAQIEATRIQADALKSLNQNQGNYNNGGNNFGVSNNSQTGGNAPLAVSFVNYFGTKHSLFACSAYNEFLDGEKGISLEDAVGVNGVKDTFSKNEKITIVSKGTKSIRLVKPGTPQVLFRYSLMDTSDGHIIESKDRRGDLDVAFEYAPGAFNPGIYRIIRSSTEAGKFNAINFRVTE